jgi:hypothetical protein
MAKPDDDWAAGEKNRWMTTASPTDWKPITREAAVSLGWRDSESGLGTVTFAWDAWFFTDQDQRIWMDQTLSWATERYDAEWAKIQQEPGDPDGPDPIDILMSRLGNLLPHENEWLTLSAVVRDAVTAYEIFLMQAFDEVLQAHGRRRVDHLRTPAWSEMANRYRLIGIDVRSPEIREILNLRNILTHQRGELRRARERDQFGKAAGAWTDRLAHLTPDLVTDYMDELGKATRGIDPIAWAYSSGGQRVPSLL